MNKNRKTKYITIIALVVAIVGMSIGFAVFSDVLTISSSATVTPSEDDFKMTIYGLIDMNEAENLFNGSTIDWTKWSKTVSYQVANDSGEPVFGDSKYNATINNSGDELRIQNITGTLTSPEDMSMYIFVIKNEGAYDTYYNASDEMLSNNGYIKSCVPGEGATPSLVQQACYSIVPSLTYLNSSGEEISVGFNDNYKINVGDFIIMQFIVYYGIDNRADGPFTVGFVDYKFEFSTAPKS